MPVKRSKLPEGWEPEWKKKKKEDDLWKKAEEKEKKKIQAQKLKATTKPVAQAQQDSAIVILDCSTEESSSEPSTSVKTARPRFLEDDSCRTLPDLRQEWVFHPKSMNSTIVSCIQPAYPNHEYVVQQYSTRANEFLSLDNGAKEVIREHGLKPLEALCVVAYTMEGTDVSPGLEPHDSFYRKYNGTLISRDVASISAFADFSFHFKHGLDKLPTIRGPVTLYRGLDRSEHEHAPSLLLVRACIVLVVMAQRPAAPFPAGASQSCPSSTSQGRRSMPSLASQTDRRIGAEPPPSPCVRGVGSVCAGGGGEGRRRVAKMGRCTPPHSSSPSRALTPAC